MEKFYQCKDVAERYDVKITTVQRWIRTGHMRAIVVGKFYRVPESALKEFEKRNTVNEEV